MKATYAAVFVLAISLLFIAPAFTRADGLPVRGRALIVQDHNPWSYTSNQQILTNLGVSFDIITPTQFSHMTLSQLNAYHTIIWSSQQYYQYQIVSIPVLRAYLVAFVAMGGNLVLHVTPWGSGSYDYTGQFLFITPVGHVMYYDDNDHVVGSSPILSGVPATITGTYASHAYFTNLPPGAKVLVDNSINQPTYFIWTLGKGTLYATMMTLEFAYGNGQGGSLLLQNELYWATR